jgi:hypothetical protein
MLDFHAKILIGLKFMGMLVRRTHLVLHMGHAAGKMHDDAQKSGRQHTHGLQIPSGCSCVYV